MIKPILHNPVDKFILGIDTALSTLFGQPKVTNRPNPAVSHTDDKLCAEEKKYAARLMRINHTGEVCAQALYQGQALTAKLDTVRDQMIKAANEENDHLEWCSNRLQQFNDHKRYLNPLWYMGSFAIGAAAGLAGDKVSLGFVAETEHQVGKHLDSHLQMLPKHDHKSRAIIAQMKTDELAHAQAAENAGAVNLPAPIKYAMKLTAKSMTKSVYYI